MALPDNACPYARPFPDGFDACPAYQPFLATSADAGRRSLPAIWTCQALEPASRPGGGGFYGACRLGTECDRGHWAEQGANAAVIRLRRAVARQMRPSYLAIYQALANQGGVATAVEAAKEEFRRWAVTADEVVAAGLDAEDLVACHGEALDDLARSPASGLGWRLPQKLVRKYRGRLGELVGPEPARQG